MDGSSVSLAARTQPAVPGVQGKQSRIASLRLSILTSSHDDNIKLDILTLLILNFPSPIDPHPDFRQIFYEDSATEKRAHLSSVVRSGDNEYGALRKEASLS